MFYLPYLMFTVTFRSKYLYLQFTGEETASEGLGDLSEVTQLISSRAQI